MSSLYFFLTPMVVFSFYRKFKELSLAIKEKNSDQIKVSLLFLSLMLVVTAIMVCAVEGVFTKS